MITLEDQDRSLWNRSQIAEAERLLRGALKRSPTGPYRLQAAISGVHAHAECFAETDWQEIVALYRLLGALRPSPVVELNAAVAQSFAHGVDAGLAALEKLECSEALDGYQPFHAARADLLRRAGRAEEAKACYLRALALTDNPTEAQFLEGRLGSLD